MKSILTLVFAGVFLWSAGTKAASPWVSTKPFTKEGMKIPLPVSTKPFTKEGIKIPLPVITQAYTLLPVEFSGDPWFMETKFLFGPSLHLPHGAQIVSVQLSAWFLNTCNADPGSVTVTAKLKCDNPLPLGTTSELASVTVSAGSPDEAIGDLQPNSASNNVRTQSLGSPHVFDSGHEYCFLEIKKESQDDADYACREGMGVALNHVTVFYTLE